MAERIIFDTDPGIDDALALLLLATSSEVKLEGITVTHGNTSQEKCLANALRLVELAGIQNVPVFAGTTEPLVKSLTVAEETHGDGGLGYAVLPAPKVKPTSIPAYEFIASTVNDNPGKITLLCVGPMTNLALALLKYPEIAPKIKRIISMGGSIHYPGNVTPQAEYNVFCDPEAFEITLRAGVDFTLVPLDVTYQCILTTEHLSQLSDCKDSVRTFIVDSTRFYMEFHAKHQAIMGCAINDPLAAALLIDPELVTLHDYFVEVDLTSPQSKAKTIADYYAISGKRANAHVATQVDVQRFMKLFIERMNRFS